METTAEYKPITKEKAALILGVSKRTIENWIADGAMPAPKEIGRRKYWHPTTFYNWLDERLGFSQCSSTASDNASVAKKKVGRPRTLSAI